MKQVKSGQFKASKQWMLLLCCLLLLAATGCGAGATTAPAAPSSAGAAKDSNACHLLSHEEVSALVEAKIVMADQTEAGETWSTCEWQDEEGRTLFWLTAYWADGREQWDAWRAGQGLGNAALKQAEGVGADDVVQQGPVAGIGDAAYFSELLPSLVLQGDVLFEINLFFVPNAETKFAGLARKLLATLK